MCFFVSKETQPSKLYTEVIWSFKELREKKIMVKVIRLVTYKSIIALQLANYNFHPQNQQTFLQNQREQIRLTSWKRGAFAMTSDQTSNRILNWTYWEVDIGKSSCWKMLFVSDDVDVFFQVFYKHISIGL